jgi:hypothetical protein
MERYTNKTDPILEQGLGSDMGVDAIEIAAINQNSDYLINFNMKM